MQTENLKILSYTNSFTLTVQKKQNLEILADSLSYSEKLIEFR